MSQLIIDLSISSEEYVKLYRGVARTVFASSRDGKKIRFPASILVPFVEREGINGSFVIDYDQHNRFQRIHRL